MSTREIAQLLADKIKADSKHAPVSDEVIVERIDAALTKAIADERERCARAICLFCAEPEHYGPPKEIEGSKRAWHSDLRNDCNGVVQCQAAAIRRNDTADTQTEGEGR
jgi:hypothetical protein